MGLFYVLIALSFFVLLIINLTFLGVNIYFWATHGLQALLQNMNFVERIEGSTYFKWIILADGLWIITGFVFLLKRKHYKTNPELHYLTEEPIKQPNICVVIPTFNEEESIKSVINDFKNGVSSLIFLY